MERFGIKGGLRVPLGKICVESGLISREQLDRVLIHQKKEGGRLGNLLVSKRMISDFDLAGSLSAQTGWPFLDVRTLLLDSKTVMKIPEPVARKHRALAVSHEHRVITVAMADPLDYEAVRDIVFSCGMEVRPAIGVPEDILEAMDRYYRPEIDFGEIIGNKDLSNGVPESDSLQDVLLVKTDDHEQEKGAVSPVVKLTGILLSEAIKQGASDIHIEPGSRKLLVRFRIDGLLREHSRLPMAIHGYLVSRFKILGKLDIAEKRLPQDGAVRVKTGDRKIDLRISTIPTVFGEKVVMRVLDREQVQISLDSLGFKPGHLKAIHSFTAMSKGIILVTGPTGSGKTTTLYSFLQKLRNGTTNLVSVEDPVEYQIDGVNQIQVNPEIGLTFAGCLRAILRQDPNIILVGEIRDSETAEIAFRAALTGHLVLSTLHTNDSFSSITRLVDLGVPRYLVSSLVAGVISQRLVRRVCSECCGESKLNNKNIGDPPANGRERKVGRCPVCLGTGLKGRMGIYEILEVTPRLRVLISKGASLQEIQSAAIESGFETLEQDGLKKARDGLTTEDEVWRVIGRQDEGISICPSCGKPLSEDFLVCPYCAEDISQTCQKCSRVIQPDWQVCPFCKHPAKSISAG